MTPAYDDVSFVMARLVPKAFPYAGTMAFFQVRVMAGTVCNVHTMLADGETCSVAGRGPWVDAFKCAYAGLGPLDLRFLEMEPSPRRRRRRRRVVTRVGRLVAGPIGRLQRWLCMFYFSCGVEKNCHGLVHVRALVKRYLLISALSWQLAWMASCSPPSSRPLAHRVETCRVAPSMQTRRLALWLPGLWPHSVSASRGGGSRVVLSRVVPGLRTPDAELRSRNSEASSWAMDHG